jgi:membrane protease YdiL (CAAX protease family)
MDTHIWHDDQGNTARRLAIRAGLSAVLLWVGIEFGIRTVGGAAGVLAIASTIGWKEPPLGHLGALNAGLLVPAMVVLWVMFDRRVRQNRIDLLNLGYRFAWGAGVTGVACGAGLLGIYWLTAVIDTRIFGSDLALLLHTMVAASPMLGILALLIGNGLLAPIVEELAWRGYIQGRLTIGWGPRAALVVTAMLFAAKHMIVDLSLDRSVTLVVISFALGVIRHRWGTSESTLAHFTLNFTATTQGVFEALTR